VAVDKGRPATAPPELNVPELEAAKTLQDLGNAAGRRFADLKEKYGKDEAAKLWKEQVGRHPLVKSAAVSEQAACGTIVPKEGRPRELLLYGYRTSKQARIDAEDNRLHWRERITANANERAREEVEWRLKHGHLVFTTSHGTIEGYRPEEARRILPAICNAVQEVARARDSIAFALKGRYASRNEYDNAWAILLNLRPYELLNDLDARAAEVDPAAEIH
jgi:hypothetical protein